MTNETKTDAKEPAIIIYGGVHYYDTLALMSYLGVTRAATQKARKLGRLNPIMRGGSPLFEISEAATYKQSRRTSK